MMTDKPLALVAPLSCRAIARQQGIDLPKLISILELRRPDMSVTEKKFVLDFLDPIEGMQKDEFGNRYLRIGDEPVLWSCHTDTVSPGGGGKQNVEWQGDILALNQPKAGQSLGADDGAGLWLMLEMIKAGRPGLYVFHRAEEVGGQGSKWIATNTPDLLEDIKMAIAFDRKATHSVITFQRGERCCSDEFATDLADTLNAAVDGLAYKLDKGGVFTDTASYTELIPECTNLSAGYYNEHTNRETLDVAHLLRLRSALLTLDVSKLTIKRDPSQVEWDNYSYGYGYNYGGGRSGVSISGDAETDKIYQIIQQFPLSTAKWLKSTGIEAVMLDGLVGKHRPYIYQPKENNEWSGALADYFAQKDDDPGHSALWCRDCQGAYYSVDDDCFSGEACPVCRSNNTISYAPEKVDEEPELEEQEALYCNQCGEYTLETMTGQWLVDGDNCDSCFSLNTKMVEVLVDPVTGEVTE